MEKTKTVVAVMEMENDIESRVKRQEKEALENAKLAEFLEEKIELDKFKGKKRKQTLKWKKLKKDSDGKTIKDENGNPMYDEYCTELLDGKTQTLANEINVKVNISASEVANAIKSLGLIAFDRDVIMDLVRRYYELQNMRIRFFSKIKKMEEAGRKEHTIHNMYAVMSKNMEDSIKLLMDAYSDSTYIGRWLKSICGIGPVLASGLISYIDINRVKTSGQIEAYAGMCPGRDKLTKGVKAPFNKGLKVLCWKAGESFIKVQNNENDVYGKIYVARKQYELENNENLLYKEQADARAKEVGKTTEAYKWYSQGKLPPAHINRRASRYAIKIFISHLFMVWYALEYNALAPRPYALAILNHAKQIKIPSLELANKLLKEKWGLNAIQLTNQY